LGCIRFLHLADLHLGRPLDFLKEYDSYYIYSNFLNNISEIIEKENIDFVLLCGDIFNNNYIEYRYRLLFKKLIKQNSHINFYYIAGNHDLYSKTFLSFILSEPNFKVFDNEGINSFAEGDIKIYGCSFDYKNPSKNPYNNLDKDYFYKNSVVLMHCNLVDLVSDHENYFPISIDQLSKFEANCYFALGHIHNYFLHEFDNKIVSYPGSPLPVRKNEVGQRYVNIVECENEKFAVKKHPLNFYIDEKVLNVNTHFNFNDVETLLMDLENDNLFYKVIFTGEINADVYENLILNKSELLDNLQNIVDIDIDSLIVKAESEELNTPFYKILEEEFRKFEFSINDKLRKVINKYDLDVNIEKVKKKAFNLLISRLMK